jgi:vacuolar protein-sorting-associated protein 4
MSWAEVDSDRLLEPPLALRDFIKAVEVSRPTVSQEDLKKNEDWTREFGSEGA